MTLKTWLEEFLPEPSKEMTRVEALRHSIKKYEGALPKNLKKHGVALHRKRIVERTNMFANMEVFVGDYCTLCLLYYNPNEKGAKACQDCPIKESGNYCRNHNSPWWTFIHTGEPYEMLRILTEALDLELAKKGEQQ